jgi:hypothetical protein
MPRRRPSAGRSPRSSSPATTTARLRTSRRWSPIDMLPSSVWGWTARQGHGSDRRGRLRVAGSRSGSSSCWVFVLPMLPRAAAGGAVRLRGVHPHSDPDGRRFRRWWLQPGRMGRRWLRRRRWGRLRRIRWRWWLQRWRGGIELVTPSPVSPTDERKGLLMAKSAMTLDDLVKQLHTVHGAGLQAVVLYGSAASDEAVAGYSDQNVLVIVGTLDLGRLRTLAQTRAPGRRREPAAAHADARRVEAFGGHLPDGVRGHPGTAPGARRHAAPRRHLHRRGAPAPPGGAGSDGQAAAAPSRRHDGRHRHPAAGGAAAGELQRAAGDLPGRASPARGAPTARRACRDPGGRRARRVRRRRVRARCGDGAGAAPSRSARRRRCSPDMSAGWTRWCCTWTDMHRRRRPELFQTLFRGRS